jgi:hypothetical protein
MVIKIYIYHVGRGYDKSTGREIIDEYTFLPKLETIIGTLLNRILVRSINSSKNNMKQLTKS